MNIILNSYIRTQRPSGYSRISTSYPLIRAPPSDLGAAHFKLQ